MPQNRNCYTIPLLMALLRLEHYLAPLVYMLTTAQIISPSLSNDALLIAGSDHTFSVYFHRRSGPASIGAGSSLPQSINTLLFPQHLLDHSHLITTALGPTHQMLTTMAPSSSSISSAMYMELYSNRLTALS